MTEQGFFSKDESSFEIRTKDKRQLSFEKKQGENDDCKISVVDKGCLSLTPDPNFTIPLPKFQIRNKEF
jgi:hypothetical protein